MTMRRLVSLITVELLAAVGLAAAAELDPCALLKPAEIQERLAPNVTLDPGKVTRQPEFGAAICSYRWGPGNNAASGQFNFHISISDAAKVFPGLSREAITEGLLAQTKKPGSNGAAISGVGDVAIFTSEAPIRADTIALVKGMVLQLDLDGPDGRGKKDPVIALLKAAAGRL
jgi:hypothetical protein